MNFLKILKQIALLSGCIAVAGCGAILPAMSLQNSNAYNNAPTADPITPTIIPVTPALISQVAVDLNPYHYIIGAGDTLSIAAWSKSGVQVSLTGSEIDAMMHPTTTAGTQAAVTLVNPALRASSSGPSMGGYFVNGDGNVFIPILGAVHLAGMTEDQADALLVQKLSAYIKHPVIQTTVTSFASQQIFILGEINGGVVGASTGTTTASMMSLPITGTPMTLATALAQAGGMNLSTANTRLIYVVRQSSLTHPSVYWLDMQSAASMLYAENFPLINNDIVYVSTAGIANFNRVLNQLLPAVQTIWFTKSIVNSTN
jgi:protein involved in polysaccharide export with SLBB domain